MKGYKMYIFTTTWPIVIHIHYYVYIISTYKSQFRVFIITIPIPICVYIKNLYNSLIGVIHNTVKRKGDHLLTDPLSFKTRNTSVLLLSLP